MSDHAEIMDEGRFRGVMRAMVSGVMVVTTFHDGRAHGMTATAFASVSAEPPTVLVAVNRSTRTHPLIAASRHFVVNLLSERQVELSQRFSGKADNPFEGVAYTVGVRGAPVLSGAAASLECETIEEVEVATHTIFIGRVLRGAASASAPLVYHDGGYKIVAAHQAA